MNGRTHKAVGLAAGVAGCLWVSSEEQWPLDLPGFFVILTGGLLGSRLADKLEPPTSPWHRGPAHSIPLGILLLEAARTTINPDRCPQLMRRNRLLRLFVMAFLCAYISHLALDLCTVNGLPGLMPGKGLSVYGLLRNAA